MTQQNINLPQLESLAMTWENFFETFKPEGLFLQYMNVDSIHKSINQKRISITEINYYYGKIRHKSYGECNSGVLYFYEWLIYLNSISNINKPLPPKAIEQLSIILYSKYYYFYLSDLKLILEGLLEGQYGKFYGSVDAQLIMSAFKEYAAARKKTEENIKSNKVIY